MLNVKLSAHPVKAGQRVGASGGHCGQNSHEVMNGRGIHPEQNQKLKFHLSLV